MYEIILYEFGLVEIIETFDQNAVGILGTLWREHSVQKLLKKGQLYVYML